MRGRRHLIGAFLMMVSHQFWPHDLSIPSQLNSATSYIETERTCGRVVTRRTGRGVRAGVGSVVIGILRCPVRRLLVRLTCAGEMGRVECAV